MRYILFLQGYQQLTGEFKELIESESEKVVKKISEGIYCTKIKNILV